MLDNQFMSGLPTRELAVGAMLLVLSITGCGSAAPADDMEGSGGDAAAPRTALQVQPVDPDPCDWIPVAEVERLVGTLAGPPWRADNAENFEPDRNGRACAYRLTTRNQWNDEPHEIAIRVEMEDATSFEIGYGMAMDALFNSTGVGLSSDEEPDPDSSEWDYTGGLPKMYVGRVGHMAVIIGTNSPDVPEGVVPRLAAAVRDRIPDLPVAAPGADPNARGRSPDPCSLISQAEAEEVLGKLAVRPYRSSESTPFADGRGSSCSYYLGRHRVLVITPSWSDGRFLFKLTAGLSQNITSLLGAGQSAADTLDGSWDQAGGGIGGELYFLKGDRMLEIQHLTAGVDEAAVVRLATLAMKRL